MIFPYVHPDGRGTRSETELIASSGVISFTVGFPQISNFSIQNQTYNTHCIPLSFNIDKEPDCKLSYILDGKQVLIGGNTTLILQEGFHSIAILAIDRQGNSAQNSPVYFTVALRASSPSPTSPPSPSPTPTPSIGPSFSPNPTPSPSIPEFPSWTALPLLCVATMSVLIFVNRRRAVR
jgi:hypothetical protein